MLQPNCSHGCQSGESFIKLSEDFQRGGHVISPNVIEINYEKVSITGGRNKMNKLGQIYGLCDKVICSKTKIVAQSALCPPAAECQRQCLSPAEVKETFAGRDLTHERVRRRSCGVRFTLNTRHMTRSERWKTCRVSSPARGGTRGLPCHMSDISAVREPHD